MATKRIGGITYRSMSKRAGAIITLHRLWCGPDHLLLIREVGCSEEYKRFYYTDIQALILVQTPVFWIWVGVFSIGLLFSLLAVMLSDTAAVGVGPVIGLCLVGLIVHLQRGPTCKCWIQTGVNRELMRMFTRVKKTRQVWSWIEKEIAAVQGDFSEQEMNQVAEPLPPSPPPVPATDQF